MLGSHPLELQQDMVTMLFKIPVNHAVCCYRPLARKCRVMREWESSPYEQGLVLQGWAQGPDGWALLCFIAQASLELVM